MSSRPAASSSSVRLAIVTATSAWLLGFAPATAEAAPEATLFVGMGKPTESELAFDWSVSLAGSVGGRLADRISLHGQLQVALLDYQAANTSGNFFQGGLLPLVHLLGGLHRVEVVAGPHLGLYRAGGRLEVLGFAADGWEWGLSAGLLAGGLFEVGRDISLGVFLQYAALFPQETCLERSGSSLCDDDPADDKGFFTLGVGAAF